MTGERRDARAWLDAWQASGADRVDPMRFSMLDALARRAARHEGPARRVLDERLAVLIAAYAADVERVQAAAAGDARARASGRPGEAQSSALAALTGHIARHAQAPHRAAWPELPMLDDFRKTWSRLSTDIQLRQSREQVPTNAGPLNSSSLVHRALALMREQSPAYLQHFLSYVDALSWLGQLNGGDDASPPKEARRATVAKKKRSR
ncbi:MAG TPA: DUF2894 domain-containing protein [Paraburkholderia sp.]|jgi:hypothetical protein|nr:DUF2894 domain-containing protein [Paraburkholderia sp.]